MNERIIEPISSLNWPDTFVVVVVFRAGVKFGDIVMYCCGMTCGGGTTGVSYGDNAVGFIQNRLNTAACQRHQETRDKPRRVYLMQQDY